MNNIEIRCSHAGNSARILPDFLQPLLNASVSYDRISNFYSADSLLSISQGVESLYERSGKMRVIIGTHGISKDTLAESLSAKDLLKHITQSRDAIVSEIASIPDALKKRRLASLVWMIEDDLLEVRIAAANQGAVFYPKTFIFKDAHGNKVAAIGGPNETGDELDSNFEQIVALKSWQNPEDVAEQENFFEKLWANKENDFTVCDLSQEIGRVITDGLDGAFPNPKHEHVVNKIPSGAIHLSSQMPANFFVSGEIPALYQHQERAVIDALSRWPVRVLFSDEVGLGKTFEIAATMSFLMKYCGVKRVLILTPKSVLYQWQDELATHFSINAWLYDSYQQSYRDIEGNCIPAEKKNPIGAKSPDIILMSAQFARGNSNVNNIFENDGVVLPDLIILDEAHSARESKQVSGHYKATRLYKMLEAVTPHIPHVIFATATPMQKEACEYHSMLKLLGLPSAWCNRLNYQTSLNLISSDQAPDINDAYTAANLLKSTFNAMKPDLNQLNVDEIRIAREIVDMGKDKFETAANVQNNWETFRSLFVKLHPAHLLTVRNTRRALENIGYKFPKRNLEEVTLHNSIEVQMFYKRVNDYISNDCFSVEKILHPGHAINIGFVRVSYQQRVASSLYSCRKSLDRRLNKLLNLRKSTEEGRLINDAFLQELGIQFEEDNVANDEMLDKDFDLVEVFGKTKNQLNKDSLKNAINIECTSIQPLLDEIDALLANPGDMKVTESIKLALEHVKQGDQVLLFSRYTDTVDALINEFIRRGGADYCYGVYTGQKSTIVNNGIEHKCNKQKIKSELSSGNLKLIICSDAASEGLNLQAARVLINVDVPWTPARLEQRIGRIARLGQVADNVEIFNVWYPNSIEARMYHRIQKRLSESNIAIGEFPDVIADGIRDLILQDKEQEDSSAYQLQEIRNSKQTKALEELWSANKSSMTTSRFIREQLIELCNQSFGVVDDNAINKMKTYLLSDGTEINLTPIEGQEETVSLTSKTWDKLDFELDDFNIVNDPMGNPAIFSYKNDSSRWLPHEAVITKILNKPSTCTSTVADCPRMLANPANLSLCFALEDKVPQQPIFWPPLIKGEI